MISDSSLRKKIAKQLNISQQDVDNILSSHVEYVKTAITEETPSVRIPYLGTLKLNRTALNKVRKNESTES